MRALGEGYAELGREWSALADAALLHNDGHDATAAVRQSWQRLDELATSAQERFPLSDSAVVGLRADLQRRVLALHDADVAAHAELSGELASER